jgi:hypothetical protein
MKRVHSDISLSPAQGEKSTSLDPSNDSGQDGKKRKASTVDAFPEKKPKSVRTSQVVS